MTCDYCHKRRGTITTAGGHILCKQCATKLDVAIEHKRVASLARLFAKRPHNG